MLGFSKHIPGRIGNQMGENNKTQKVRCENFLWHLKIAKSGSESEVHVDKGGGGTNVHLLYLVPTRPEHLHAQRANHETKKNYVILL